MNNQIEIWKDVPGYEGLYQVSNFGRVKSTANNATRKEKVLKAQLHDNKYLKVGVRKNKKSKHFKIHQLVAMAFLGHIPCGNEIEVNHKDKNKLNNRLDNLEVLTREEHYKVTYTNKTSKYKGVWFDKKRNKWIASIKIKGKNKTLGTFDTEEEAYIVRKEAEEMALLEDYSFLEFKKNRIFKNFYVSKQHNKWKASIRVNDKNKYIGSFNTEKEALEAIKKTEEILANGGEPIIITKRTGKQKEVYWCKCKNKWRGRIKINGKRKHIGYYIDKIDAQNAVIKALENE
jgi:hypothetical protein